jgi:hypothetical protein
MANSQKDRECLIQVILLFQFVFFFISIMYSWLQKNGNCQNKIDTFLQFFHSVNPSYER